MTEISIILPVYNEEGSLNAIYDSLKNVINSLSVPFEILFVDDGSTDNTNRVLKEISASDPLVRVISFNRNYGQASAIQAGFDHTDGDIIVTLDSDLENDPKDMPLLLKKLEEGYDVVCGRRLGRPLTVKKFFSSFGNLLFRKVFKTPVRDMACTFRAYRRKALEDIAIRGSLHRYLPVILHLKGAKIAEVDVRWIQRRHGESKYGVIDRFFPTIRGLFILLLRKKKVLENRVREYNIEEAR